MIISQRYRIRETMLGLVLLVLASCSTAEDVTPEYFPIGVLSEYSDDFVREWYTQQLIALKEPPLYGREATQTSSYRFLWLRTFNHPIAVRIEMAQNRTATAYYNIADGAGGYDPGKLITNEQQILTDTEIDQFTALFSAADICNPVPDEIVGSDGSQWVFESRIGADYCIADTWEGQYGPYYDLGVFMLELVGFE